MYYTELDYPIVTAILERMLYPVSSSYEIVTSNVWLSHCDITSLLTRLNCQSECLRLKDCILFENPW